MCAQRPTTKDLLKTKFILKAKKTSYLVELIERYRKWKEAGGKDDSSSDDDSDKGPHEFVDPGWEFGTVKGGVSPVVAAAVFQPEHPHLRSRPQAGDGAPSASKQSKLQAVLLPALAQAKKKVAAENPEHPAAALKLVDELSKALELAEVSKPGISDRIVEQICMTMSGCVEATVAAAALTALQHVRKCIDVWRLDPCGWHAVAMV